MTFALPFWALVRRELLTQLRLVRTFSFIALFVGVCIVVIWTWLPENELMLWRGAAMSQEILGVLSVTLLIGAGIVTPAIAATAIVGEKERETFDMLYLTYVRPSGILFAKLINTMGILFLLFIASLPIFGVTFFLVGVDWTQFLKGLIIIAAYSLTWASLGLLSSSLFRKTLPAVVSAYMGILVLVFGPLLVILTLTEIFRIRMIPNTMQIFYALFPLAALTDGVSRMSTESMYVMIAIHLVFSALCLDLAWRRIRKAPDTVAAANKPSIADPATLRQRRRRFPFYLVDPLRRKPAIEDGRNPMLVRELRWGVLTGQTNMIRTFYLTFFLLACVQTFVGIVATSNPRDYLEAAVIAVEVMMLITAFVAPVAQANILPREYEAGNIDALRMTLLTPREIVLGKLGAGAVALMPILVVETLATVPMFVITTRFGVGQSLVLTGYVSLLTTTALSLAASLFASSFTRKTSIALIASYGLLSLICFGVFLGFALIGESRSARALMPQEDWAIIGAIPSPMLVYGVNSDDVMVEIRKLMQKPGYLWTDFSSVPLPHFITGYWVASVVFSLLLAFLMVLLSIIIFRRNRLRER
ncbi:MAG: ABC transporter permease [Candidatus Hydrogenedentes bacterium]|nr:ABC transporter permease [Candidatus Hydrogenedentota bacterium]